MRKMHNFTAWVAEISKGRFLQMRETDDGLYGDSTESLSLAWWDRNLDGLKRTVHEEFRDFPKEYPKYRKVRFSHELLETRRDAE